MINLPAPVLCNMVILRPRVKELGRRGNEGQISYTQCVGPPNTFIRMLQRGRQPESWGRGKEEERRPECV